MNFMECIIAWARIKGSVQQGIAIEKEVITDFIKEYQENKPRIQSGGLPSNLKKKDNIGVLLLKT